MIHNRKTLFCRLSSSLPIGIIALVLGACSSDNNSENEINNEETTDSVLDGVFLDSAVAGLDYKTSTQSGITGESGAFHYNAGEMVTFSIGNLELPKVPATNIITPLSLFGSSEVSDTRVTNLARLLQSMDTDSITSNGITLPNKDLLNGVISADSLSFSSPDFDAQALTVLTSLFGESAALVDNNTASAHLTQTLIDHNIISAGCSSEHRFVGRSAELSSKAHGVSGTLTVLDDCTIEVANFNYDGGGPSVFFYAAVDRDFSNYSAILGPQLNGQEWINETLQLVIPDGISLDNFNSLSVWCSDFDANFGDVFFGDQ